jgi:hypothetical protein
MEIRREGALMRRFVYLVAAVVPLVGATGCEDGPNQTYSPAPGNAGNVWNGSTGVGIPEGGAFTGSATEGYDASFGGTNANITCTADEATKRWQNLFQEPIEIPGLAAGLDIAGGPNGDGLSGYTGPTTPFKYDPTKETWVGATVEEAEKLLCSGVADSIFYQTTNTLGFGNADEVSLMYDVNSRVIQYLLFQYGYVGGLSGTSADGKTTYTINITNLPISVSQNGQVGQPLLIPWPAMMGGSLAQVYAVADGLYEALRASYIPGFAADPGFPASNGGAACQAAGHCIVGNNYTQGGYLYFPPLNLAMYVNNTLAPQPAASTFTLIQLGVLKLLPFSVGSNLLKLDTEGPTQLTLNPGGSAGNCTYKLGDQWADFNKNCVQVYSGSLAAQNTIQENKLLGGMTHTDETFGFNNVVGIDPQFAATTLQPNQVIADGQTPAAGDTIYQFNVDQQALGSFANDYTNNAASPSDTPDLHGYGLLTLEYVNMLQQYMVLNGYANTQLGDPDCVANPVAPATKGKLCSGLEGVITTAPAASVTGNMTYNAPGFAKLFEGAAGAFEGGYGSGFHPGTWVLDFCTTNAGSIALPQTGGQLYSAVSATSSAAALGYAQCEGGAYTGPLGGYYFDSPQYMIEAVLGSRGGVPATFQSRRFFFQQWMFALVKYLQVAGDLTKQTLADVDSQTYDPNQIFFDSGGGGFDNAEYVFRNNVNSGMQPPLVIDVQSNLTTSVVNNFTFYRANLRGESMMYSLLRTQPSDYLGAEPLYITNIVGSPVLQSVFGTYKCATTTCNGYNPTPDPQDSTGKTPLYAPYAAAFQQSAFAIAPNNSTPYPAPLSIDTKGANNQYPYIESAMVTVPIWSNPFDPTSATPGDKTLSTLVNYEPVGSDQGFPVTIDGSRDKWYNANTLNLSGISFSATVNYDFFATTTQDGGVGQGVAIRAFQMGDFLGEVFTCAQPNPNAQSLPATTNPTDILGVRMYQNAADILSWLANHPNATGSCGVQIKYSIYGNYPDYISFLNNGVRLGLNAEFGGAVVTDVVLFDPNVVSGLGQ